MVVNQPSPKTSRPNDPGAVVLLKGPLFSKIHLPNLFTTKDISKMFG